jgi:hypothetical protein
MFGDECRHCSIEKASGKVTLLKKDIHNGMLVSRGESFNVMEVGAWCNNDGKHWVADLDRCPSRWDRANRVVPQQVWAVSKTAPIVERQVPVVCGQQRLVL